MTEKQVAEKVEAYITETEADLMLKAQGISLQIKILSAPFTDPNHPANFILQDYLKRHADLDDYSLIERVNSLVDDLERERDEVMMQMKRLRRDRS